MQRRDEPGGSPALMLVHRAARCGGLVGRTGDVEQHEYRQVAARPDGIHVDRVVRRGSRGSLDEGFDRGVDVDVVTLELPVTALELRAEARERAP